jgi:uncharacterized protein (TIGR03067 family)
MNGRVLSGLLSTLALAGCTSVPRAIPLAGPTLAGQWAPVFAELGGQEFPVANFGGATLRLTADTYEFAGDKGTYAILSVNPPATMDIRGREGPNAGRTIPAIYALAGDQLTICYQLGSGERPSEFTSSKGSRLLLVRYKRMQ